MRPGNIWDTRALFKAVTGALSSWWCMDLHPAFGVAVRGLANGGMAAGFFALVLMSMPCSTPTHRLCTFASSWVCNCAGLGQGLPSLSCASGAIHSMQDNQSLHHLRMRARRLALALVPRTRKDSEGIERIDLEAVSHPRFKRFFVFPIDRRGHPAGYL